MAFSDTWPVREETTAEKGTPPTVAYALIWYGKQGILEKVSFDAEKAARDHAMASFPARSG
ncbi:hypothetical protein B5V02_24120 [Mesorhizobium kowhaii]|uniref:Uncharacterized protein n=1 Tax=Mesorhizobium kowhaii TaxID=1300272 RepID=A0A2W7C385_9HYPH|nr:hypothetical protein B5V02_24120 [Mesorhizobium kowhaii]